jgi:hypothetical protein
LEVNSWPEDAFDQFWAIYPKKRNKGDARRALEKTAARRTPFAVILRGVKTFARVQPWREFQFCPYPASWLNAEAWDNEYDEPASEKPKHGHAGNNIQFAFDNLMARINGRPAGDGGRSFGNG